MASQVLAQKVMPYNLQAEICVLGCMVLNNESIDTVSGILREEDFHSPNNRSVFAAIIRLNMVGSPVDSITLSDELKKNEVFEKIGGISYLAEIADSVLSTKNVEEYCKIVKDCAMRRMIINQMSEIVEKSYSGKNSIEELIEDAERSVYNISMDKTGSEFVTLAKAVEESVLTLREVYKNPSQITGIETGYHEIDVATAGFQRGDLILIAGRPSMGKTALAVNIAQNAALRGGHTVALFSLEMSTIQLTNRILSSEAEVDSSKIKVGKASIDEWTKIINTFQEIKQEGARLYIDDTSGISVSEMRSKCRKLKAKKGLDLIIIDYLQLITTNERTESRQQEVSAISRSLKALAKEIDCPVVALSQLSRAPESRQNKRPMLSDLRESGAIEQDADLVFLLYRENYYKDDTDDNSTEIIIAKHRNGSTGTVKLTFHGEYTKFTPEEVDMTNDIESFEQ